MLTLEGVGLSTFDLQIEECRQVGYLLLHSIQAYQTVQLFHTFRDIDRLRCLVWDISLYDRHQFLVGHGRDALLLQALGLFLTDLIEQGAHRTTIGEVLVTGVV